MLRTGFQTTEVPLCQSTTIHNHLLTKADGSWTDSEKESLDLLLDTHFAGSESAEPTIAAGICSYAHVKHDKITDNIFTPENLNWAINSFKPFKTI